MQQFGTSQEEHRKRVAERTRALGSDATVHDLDIVQEQEILKLSDRWSDNWQDLQIEAAEKKAVCC